LDERSTIKIKTLKKLLSDYSGRLASAFVVVTETTIRVAKRL
jgi:hypothetical protein